MSDTKNLDESELLKIIKELSDKIKSFSSILEKFGLDIITKMGQTNLKVNMLSDKIAEVHDATLDIKSLTPQLVNIIENQKKLQEELSLMKSLIMNIRTISADSKIVSDEIPRDKSATDKKKVIIEKLTNLKEEIEILDDPNAIKTILENIKEDIFEYTGGHRILHEISKTISRLSSIDSLSSNINNESPKSETMESYLKEKITFWINKLMVKDKKVI